VSEDSCGTYRGSEMKTENEKIIEFRQWAVEQAVKAGAQPEAVRHYADIYLVYALQDLPGAPK